MIGIVALFALQTMSQEVPDVVEEQHYTLVEILVDYRYAVVPFLIILGLKFVKNRRIPESANFIPFFMGLAHALLSWVWFCRTAVMGHPDRMANISLEMIAFGSIFTVLMIAVDVVRGLIKPVK